MRRLSIDHGSGDRTRFIDGIIKFGVLLGGTYNLIVLGPLRNCSPRKPRREGVIVYREERGVCPVADIRKTIYRTIQRAAAWYA